MARSKYIYLVREKETGKLLSALTVKHEASKWVIKAGWMFHEVYLSSMRDGLVVGPVLTHQKGETLLKWE